jgi:cytochrome c peroxidase
MHDGRYKTLEEVINHYSENIKNNAKLSPLLKFNDKPRIFNFSAQEKADLLAFLLTLDDDKMCTDIKFSSPFIN